jgi:ABC-type multidrug transport system fused ATPase/permease subunit
MLRKIIRAPIRFFDKTPVGSILNRFSNDLGQLDKVNWGALVDVFGGAIGITVLTITVVSLNFYVIIPVLLVGFGLRRFRDFFAKPTGETKRLDLVSRSPMYSDISSTIHGLLIVRVFRQGGRFIQRFLNLIHNNSRAMGFQQRVQRLFGMLLDLWLYALTVSGIFLYIYISFSSLIDPGLFGFALSLLLEISNQSGYFIKQSLVVDVSMQSCERVLRYTKLEEEAEDSIPSTDN